LPLGISAVAVALIVAVPTVVLRRSICVPVATVAPLAIGLVAASSANIVAPAAVTVACGPPVTTV
jgi:hypothetical protein